MVEIVKGGKVEGSKWTIKGSLGGAGDLKVKGATVYSDSKLNYDIRIKIKLFQSLSLT